MRWVPARSWKIIPEEMIGEIPSSINVPRLLAIIIRNQYSGSDDYIPVVSISSRCVSPEELLVIHLRTQFRIAAFDS